MTNNRSPLPTIDEIRGRSLSATGHPRGGLDSLIPVTADEITHHSVEHQVHTDYVRRQTTVPTTDEERSLRLAVKHLASALGARPDDLRQVTMTPHAITARIAAEDAGPDDFRGRVLLPKQGRS